MELGYITFYLHTTRKITHPIAFKTLRLLCWSIFGVYITTNMYTVQVILSDRSFQVNVLKSNGTS